MTETINLSRALRLKKKLIEKVRKAEQEIQSNNSFLIGNTPEYDVQVLYETRQKLIKQLVSLKIALQQATMPIMQNILELAETKAEIVFWQRVDTTFGIQRDYGDHTPEYSAVFRKSQVDSKVADLQDKIDQIQTRIDDYNASTNIYLDADGFYSLCK